MEDKLVFTICVVALIVILIVCLRALKKNMKDMKVGFSWITGFTFSCSFYKPEIKR